MYVDGWWIDWLIDWFDQATKSIMKIDLNSRRSLFFYDQGTAFVPVSLGSPIQSIILLLYGPFLRLRQNSTS